MQKKKTPLSVMRKLFDVAKTILSISEYNITYNELTNMLYIVHMLYIGVKKDCLCNAHFEVGKNGIIEIALYEELSGFESALIPRWSFMTSNLIPKDKEDFIIIQKIIDVLNRKSKMFLIYYMKDDKSVWKNIYKEDEDKKISFLERIFGKEGNKIEISNEDILDEYSRRFSKLSTETVDNPVDNYTLSIGT